MSGGAMKNGAGSRPLRGRLAGDMDAIVIAASTGGPQALAALFSKLGKMIGDIPVFVVMHMPEHFTEVVTSQIERISGCKTSGASTDAVAKAGHIYFAPGDRHLVLKRHGLAVTMHLNDGPAINYFRPSADMLFSSAAEAFGPRVIAIVLSGMGSDGCNGATQIASAGGVVVAQDQETSAVWGMPAAVVEAGIASSVLPIDSIAEYVGRLLNRADGAAA